MRVRCTVCQHVFELSTGALPEEPLPEHMRENDSTVPCTGGGHPGERLEI